MKRYSTVGEVDDSERAGRTVAIGVFDGVHLGHQRILLEAVEQARRHSWLSMAITFHPHPDTILHPDGAPRFLTSPERRAALIQSLGLDELLTFRFDREFSRLTAGSFCRHVFSDALAPRLVLVGENFRFGAGGRGTWEDLAEYGRQHGFAVQAVGLAETDGAPISSTRIRELLYEGRVQDAARLLGRPHQLEGVIVRGVGRGRSLQAPTANLDVDPQMALPLQGVYVTVALVNDVPHQSVTSIGSNPTFESDGRTRIETALLDYRGDLYGRPMAVDFLERIRGQQPFPDAGSLALSIRRDIQFARDYFNRQAREV